MILQNERVLLELADNTGVFIRLLDKQSGMEFIQAAAETPLRVNVQENPRRMRTLKIQDFSYTANTEGLSLCWKLEQNVTLKARVCLLQDGFGVTSEAECGGDVTVETVEYPVIGGMGRWSDECEMVHSFATGLLVKNPLDNFADGEGVRFAPYPECFSGASMQLYAYYALDKGGLCFASEDGESHQKWLNLYRNCGAMEASMMYGYEDIGEGKSVHAPYTFAVRFLGGKGWWEAAQMYKDWAVKQDWCAQGVAAEREHCDWLMNDVGLFTFGISAGRDRSEYIKKYHNDVGTSIFHVLGPDWTNTPQTFTGECPGGLTDWVPTKFNAETLSAIHEVGDYFAPFEFDMMALPNKAEAEEVAANRHVFPAPPFTYSCDKYEFHMLCPCQPYTHYIHVKRDEQITREADADAMYYDISASNLLHVCLSKDHDHPVGGGNVLTRAYKKLYRDTKDACAKVKGRYFPVGTEMVNEVFLPELDFYQSRAGGQPCSALEMWPYKKLLDKGEAQLIPMFDFVYHEYGVVRMDGWGKLVEEIGDLFYDTVAKIYLWGGLYELNYEYSPAEAFDGVETRGDEHYYPFGEFGYEYSHGRARYLRQFAALRTGIGNRYLAYGRMLPPLSINVSEREKHYHHYNHGLKEIYSGAINLPAVRASRWETCGGESKSYALFFVNTELDEQAVTLSLSSVDYDGASIVTQYVSFDPACEPTKTTLGHIPKEGALSLSIALPTRKIIMLEIN